MSLYTEWQALSTKERTQEQYDQFWGEYLPKEQAIYEQILLENQKAIEGSLAFLAEKFEMSETVFCGFMDGINTSLMEEIDLEFLTGESFIKLEVNFEKLYYNMMAAQAEWLYNLSQWDDILTLEQRKNIKKEYNKSKIVVKGKKIGRNDLCPCGSGKKYKHCCLNKA
ncbi:MAG: SEC-C domain-containing protein [Tissierellales bacterium]|nr:SEC-C domain-containing protein [Tissierellales bacterium]MBN2827814.1 SEC-C domain-containing protein [Tissierellales bacterium]